MGQELLKYIKVGGAWLAQSEEHMTHDVTVLSSKESKLKVLHSTKLPFIEKGMGLRYTKLKLLPHKPFKNYFG